MTKQKYTEVSIKYISTISKNLKYQNDTKKIIYRFSSPTQMFYLSIYLYLYLSIYLHIYSNHLSVFINSQRAAVPSGDAF